MGKLFVLGDPHLSRGVKKPMDIFGKDWENHEERLSENWKNLVSEDDIVVINGDISWGLKLNEAIPDLKFINGLPGTKLLMKGNHELWWSTCGKLRQIFKDEGMNSLKPIYNNAYYIPKTNTLICGTRGWKTPEEESFTEDDLKIMKREMMRAELSLKYGKDLVRHYNEYVLNEGSERRFDESEILGDRPSNIHEEEPEIIFFMHYPPFDFGRKKSSEWNELFVKHGIKRCYFGHVHGAGHAKLDGVGRELPSFKSDGIEFYLTSADFTELKPIQIDI